MKFLFAFLAVLFSLFANCQITPVNFADCKIDQMFISADTQPKWSCDTISLIDYMNKNITDQNLKKVVEGRIFIGILIYPDGTVCGKSFADLTKSGLIPERFKDVVNKMPKWSPATQAGNKITFLIQQVFTIKDGKFI